MIRGLVSLQFSIKMLIKDLFSGESADTLAIKVKTHLGDAMPISASYLRQAIGTGMKVFGTVINIPEAKMLSNQTVKDVFAGKQ